MSSPPAIINSALNVSTFMPMFVTSRVSGQRRPCAVIASKEIVRAVPSDMARTAAMPLAVKPNANASTKTKIAPEQGRMPTAKATRAARRQLDASSTCSGVGM